MPPNTGEEQQHERGSEASLRRSPDTINHDDRNRKKKSRLQSFQRRLRSQPGPRGTQASSSSNMRALPTTRQARKERRLPRQLEPEPQPTPQETAPTRPLLDRQYYLNPPTPVLVTSAGANDVLLGRGSRSNHHPGNIFFRDSVKARVADFTQPGADRRDKTRIALSIIATVHDRGGRFLREVDASYLAKQYLQREEELRSRSKAEYEDEHEHDGGKKKAKRPSAKRTTAAVERSGRASTTSVNTNATTATAEQVAGDDHCDRPHYQDEEQDQEQGADESSTISGSSSSLSSSPSLHRSSSGDGGAGMSDNPSHADPNTASSAVMMRRGVKRDRDHRTAHRHRDRRRSRSREHKKHAADSTQHDDVLPLRALPDEPASSHFPAAAGAVATTTTTDDYQHGPATKRAKAAHSSSTESTTPTTCGSDSASASTSMSSLSTSSASPPPPRPSSSRLPPAGAEIARFVVIFDESTLILKTKQVFRHFVRSAVNDAAAAPAAPAGSALSRNKAAAAAAANARPEQGDALGGWAQQQLHRYQQHGGVTSSGTTIMGNPAWMMLPANSNAINRSGLQPPQRHRTQMHEHPRLPSPPSMAMVPPAAIPRHLPSPQAIPLPTQQPQQQQRQSGRSPMVDNASNGSRNHCQHAPGSPDGEKHRSQHRNLASTIIANHQEGHHGRVDHHVDHHGNGSTEHATAGICRTLSSAIMSETALDHAASNGNSNSNSNKAVIDMAQCLLVAFGLLRDPQQQQQQQQQQQHSYTSLHEAARKATLAAQDSQRRSSHTISEDGSSSESHPWGNHDEMMTANSRSSAASSRADRRSSSFTAETTTGSIHSGASAPIIGGCVQHDPVHQQQQHHRDVQLKEFVMKSPGDHAASGAGVTNFAGSSPPPPPSEIMGHDDPMSRRQSLERQQQQPVHRLSSQSLGSSSSHRSGVILHAPQKDCTEYTNQSQNQVQAQAHRDAKTQTQQQVQPHDSSMGRTNSPFVEESHAQHHDRHRQQQQQQQQEKHRLATDSNMHGPANVNSQHDQPQPQPQPIADHAEEYGTVHANDDEWSCPQCTLLNPKTRTNCDACNYHNPSSAIPSEEQQNRDFEEVVSFLQESSSGAIGGDRITTLMPPSNQRRHSSYSIGGGNATSLRRHSTSDLSFARSSAALGIAGYPTLGEDDEDPVPFDFGTDYGVDGGQSHNLVTSNVSNRHSFTNATTSSTIATTSTVTTTRSEADDPASDSGFGTTSTTTGRFQPRSSFHLPQHRHSTNSVTMPTTTSTGATAATTSSMVSYIDDNENNTNRRQSAPVLGSNNNTPELTLEQLLIDYGAGFATPFEMFGASERLIRKLPTQILKENFELPEGARQCQICLEDFVGGDNRKVLPCLHGFHCDCVDTWLRSNACCPMCKFRVDDDDETDGM